MASFTVATKMSPMDAYRRCEPPSTLMHRTSLAPELSAPRSRDSCWITWHAPAPRPPATASASTAVGSPAPAPCHRCGRRSSRRGRRGAWCAVPSWRSGGGAPSRSLPPRLSCSWRWRRPCPPAPCAGWAGPPPDPGRGAGTSGLPAPVAGARRRGMGCGLLRRFQRLRFFYLPFPEHGEDAGHIAPQLSQAFGIVELTGDQLEAEVEQLLLGLAQAGAQFVGVHLSKVGRRRHQTSTSSDRTTILAFMGSFWMARSMAERASSSLTPASSNSTRPG